MIKRIEERTMEKGQYARNMSIGDSRSGGEFLSERRESPAGVVEVISLKGAKRPDPEVPVKASRRKFTAQYKKRILKEAEDCRETPGAMGALLRREGLYSSHITTWRRQREKGELSGLSPQKRGRKSIPINPLARKVRELEAENRRLQKKLKKAETVISFQKKLSEMLGISLDQKEERDGQC